MTIADPTSAHAIPVGADEFSALRRSRLRTALKFCLRQPLGTFGMVIVVIMAIAGLCAE